MNLVTYAIRRPPGTHRRRVTCAAVECAAWRDGWVTAIDPTFRGDGWTGQDQLDFLRADQTRHHTEHVRGDGVVEFHYPPGQHCFAQHTRALEREPDYLRIGRRERYRHDTAEHWVEDFATNQERLLKLID